MRRFRVHQHSTLTDRQRWMWLVSQLSWHVTKEMFCRWARPTQARLRWLDQQRPTFPLNQVDGQSTGANLSSNERLGVSSVYVPVWFFCIATRQGARSSEFTYGTTLLDALTTLAGAATVAYERGSNLNSSIPNGVKNAVSVASEADVTVLCLGEGAEAEEVRTVTTWSDWEYVEFFLCRWETSTLCWSIRPSSNCIMKFAGLRNV